LFLNYLVKRCVKENDFENNEPFNLGGMSVKKLLLVAAVLFLTIPCAFAQYPSGRISGDVLDDSTDNGIMMASVTATRVVGDPFEKTVHSGWGGHYYINHLPPGSYVVTATKIGWSEGEYPDTILVNDDAHNGIDIYLHEIPIVYGSISGVITDASTSAPIEGAGVVVRGAGFWNYHFAETGADGSYSVDELAPENYTVTAHKEGYFPGEYPNPVEIDGNDTSGIDIALTVVVPTGISGTVTDLATGNPIEGARVMAFNVNHWHHRMAYTDANGDYDIETPPGEYRVQAVDEGYLLEEYPTLVFVAETGYTVDIDFALTSFNFGSISGMVTDTAGAPLNHAKVIARRYDSYFGRAAWTNETGAYTIENLIPADYRVHAYKWGFEPAIYPDTVVVPDGGNVTDINFALTPPPPPFNGTISGTVTDDSTGLPIGDASVLAIGHNSGAPWFHRWVFRRTFTDDAGNYTLESLPEIPFTIFTRAEGYIGEFYDNVSHYSEATPVTPNAENINIALAPRDYPGIRTIVGQITNTDDEYIDGSIVYLKSNGEIIDIVAGDLEGYYGFNGLAPGIYEVSAFSPYGEGFLDAPIELAFDDYNNANIVIAVTSVDDNAEILPEQSSLSQNYPNPFNAQTTISFNLQNSRKS